MDRLAAESVRFSRFYASPVCAPTRASLMTGRHYLRTGIYNTRFGGDTMLPEEVTLADVLRAHGYRTGLFGKWHLGHYSRAHPNRRGFDEFLGFPQGHIERYEHPNQLNHNGLPVEARGHVTEVESLTWSVSDPLQLHHSRNHSILPSSRPFPLDSHRVELER